MSDSIVRIDRLIGEVKAAGQAGPVVSDTQYTKLVAAVSDGLQVPPPPGDPQTVTATAHTYQSVSRDMSTVEHEMETARRKVGKAWQGNAASAAARSMDAIGRGAERTSRAYRDGADALLVLATDIEKACKQHTEALNQLYQSYRLLESLSGHLPHRPVPSPGPQPGAPAPQGPTPAQIEAQVTTVYNSAFSWASAGSETMRAAAGIADEGGRSSAATAAAAAMAKLNDQDRQRFDALLAGAKSPQERAYLLKALAAGHNVNEVEAFDALIHAHGDDPAWLAERLTPIRNTGSPEPTGTQDYKATYQGGGWDQVGPTCVASSTVVGRAAVDPIYSLQLTTGGHPGDPAHDSAAGFLRRLHAEQNRDYDSARPFYADWWGVGYDGVDNGRGAGLATREIGSRTGVSYSAHDVSTPTDTRAVLPQVERAVDSGRPVPISISGTIDGQPAGHQVLVIGHQGSMLQVYNPWGYTVWVSEDDFINGHMDKAVQGTNLPKVTNVRVPEAR